MSWNSSSSLFCLGRGPLDLRCPCLCACAHQLCLVHLHCVLNCGPVQYVVKLRVTPPPQYTTSTEKLKKGKSPIGNYVSPYRNTATTTTTDTGSDGKRFAKCKKSIRIEFRKSIIRGFECGLLLLRVPSALRKASATSFIRKTPPNIRSKGQGMNPVNHWFSGSTTTPTKTENEASDQELVMALFFHKFEYGSIWKSVNYNERLNFHHYAKNLEDIKNMLTKIQNQVHEQNKKPTDEITKRNYYSHYYSVLSLPTPLLFLYQKPTKKPQNTDYPNYDIFRTINCNTIDSLGKNSFSFEFNYPKSEVLTVEEGRNDCFEGIIIFLIMMHFTLMWKRD